MGVCTTMHCQTASPLVQKLNVCTAGKKYSPKKTVANINERKHNKSEASHSNYHFYTGNISAHYYINFLFFRHIQMAYAFHGTEAQIISYTPMIRVFPIQTYLAGPFINLTSPQHKVFFNLSQYKSILGEGLEIRGCREPRAPSNSPAAHSNFSREPKNVLVSIHNTFR